MCVGSFAKQLGDDDDTGIGNKADWLTQAARDAEMLRGRGQVVV